MQSFYAFFLVCLFSCFGSSAQTIHWDNPLPVNNGSNGQAGPQIGFLNANTPVVAWGEAGTDQLWLSIWSGDAFQPAIQVPTGGYASPVYDFGGFDMATGAGNIYIVFENYTHGIFCVRSVDGGQTFDPPVPVYHLEPGLFATLATVTTDDNGHPIISFILENDNETQGTYRTARSLDGGLSFQPLVTSSAPADGDFVCECCWGDMAVSGDSIWLAFRRNDNNVRDIWISRSTDSGQSFDLAADADPINWTSNVCPISGPSLIKTSDELVTAWMSVSGGLARVHLSTVDPAEMTLTASLTLPLTGTGPQNRPSVSASTNGYLVVWEESGLPDTGTDIMMSYSESGFSDIGQLTERATPLTGIQRYPDLAYSDERFHLVFSDIPSGQVWYQSGTVGPVQTHQMPHQPSELNAFLHHHAREIYVEAPETGMYRTVLLSMTGQSLYMQSGYAIAGEGISLSVPTLPAGIYWLQFRAENRVWQSQLANMP